MSCPVNPATLTAPVLFPYLSVLYIANVSNRPELIMSQTFIFRGLQRVCLCFLFRFESSIFLIFFLFLFLWRLQRLEFATLSACHFVAVRCCRW
ncbi:hypothetical protein BC826DRAFT_1008090 [Russula brevipes]|nr:hypothetical protein BC826DRAFT_1008090 [Russula brevipes]